MGQAEGRVERLRHGGEGVDEFVIVALNDAELKLAAPQWLRYETASSTLASRHGPMRETQE